MNMGFLRFTPGHEGCIRKLCNNKKKDPPSFSHLIFPQNLIKLFVFFFKHVSYFMVTTPRTSTSRSIQQRELEQPIKN